MTPTPIPGRREVRGFTLIELLTVIAIIGILAAILIPTLGKVRESARTATCLSNLRQIGAAIQLYAQENRGFIPAALGGLAAESGGNPKGAQWTLELNPYVEREVAGLGNVSAFFGCPQFRASYPQATGAWRQGYGYQVYFHRQAGRNTLTERMRLRLDQIPEPTRTVVVADSSRETLRAANDGLFAVNTNAATNGAYYEGAPERHGGDRGNYLFLSGHVRTMTEGDAREELRLR